MLKISLIQMNMLFCKPDENFERAKELIRTAANDGCDVAVLPEMWNTGFLPKSDFESLCDKDGCRAKTEIGALARELKINIVAGSVANIKNKKRYNTSYVFNTSGEVIAQYDKVNLFSPMDEHLYFEGGTDCCEFEIDNMKCSIIICYDIRFPELVKKASDGCDIVFMPAQWPNVRTDQLEALLKERSAESNAYFVCCNSCGTADGNVFGGRSLACDRNGSVIKKACESEEILQFEI